MPEHPIAIYREKEGLTQSAFGNLVGVTDMTVSRWERGEILPRRKYWPKLVELTGRPIAAFIEAAE